MNPPEPGWYRDPYFKNRERYWDGEIWTDECRVIQPALPAAERAATAAPGPGAGAGTVAGTGAVAGAGVGAGASTEGIDRPDPVTAQQPMVIKDPVTTQQPVTPPPADTQPIRIFSGRAAGVSAAAILGANAPDQDRVTGAATHARPEADTPPTKAEVAASAARVRTVGAAALLGGDAPVAGATTEEAYQPPPPPTRSVRRPKQPPPEATRRIDQEADPLLGVSMPGTDSAWAATPATQEETSKSHRRSLIIAVAAVVIVLAGLGAYLFLGRNTTKGGGGGGASNVVAAAAKATVHQKTAHVAIDVKVSTPGLGQIQGSSGVGDFDLAKNQGTLALSVPGVPPPGDEQQLVFDKKTVYVNLGSELSAVLPGKTWLSAEVLQMGSATQSVGTSLSGFERMVGNPSGSLRQLKGQGTKVVSLGNSTFDGTSVQGYTVTLSSEDVNRTADLVPASHTTETVYIADGLIKAIVIPATQSIGGQLLNQNTFIVLSNYGAPVTVTTPPSSQVATIAQYQAAVASKPTTSSTVTPSGSGSAATSPGVG